MLSKLSDCFAYNSMVLTFWIPDFLWLFLQVSPLCRAIAVVYTVQSPCHRPGAQLICQIRRLVVAGAHHTHSCKDLWDPTINLKITVDKPSKTLMEVMKKRTPLPC